ncbi:hypothetical protein B0A55_07592 [Friedmanniomyces simplex]|uniref:Methyltransferase domain-containing protein n=1 Tax=Friedmanniomyces simplex TaxID=329884 RepID=A0A4U0X4G2_9PEZI|nr:hypothetical protein B0A55_07592 [Friedmanniomyces simplex]
MDKFMEHIEKHDDNQTEQQRLKGQHEVILHAMGGRAVYAPIDLPKPGLRILDSGGANRRWVKDLRASLPVQHAYVCTDVVPSLFPTHPPDGMSFQAQDIREPWPANMHGTFDLVHQRFVMAAAAPTPQIQVAASLASLL